MTDDYVPAMCMLVGFGRMHYNIANLTPQKKQTDNLNSHHAPKGIQIKKTGHSALNTCITGRNRRIDDMLKRVT